MFASLREHQFDTVLGPIDFDDKGDLTVQKPVWYIWRGGQYMPLEEARGSLPLARDPSKRRPS